MRLGSRRSAESWEKDEPVGHGRCAKEGAAREKKARRAKEIEMGIGNEAGKNELALLAGVEAATSPLDKLAEAATRLSKEGLFASAIPGLEIAKVKAPSLKKRLSKAISSMSIEAVQSAIDDGADIWRGTVFYGDYGVEGDEQIAAFNKSRPEGYSGSAFVFRAWSKGVGKWIHKNPEKVAAMAIYLEGLGFPMSGEASNDGLSWLEGLRPKPGQARERTPAQIAKERRAAITVWCSTDSWECSWSSLTSEKKMEQGIMSLAKRWHEEPVEKGGLPAGEWRELILAKMLSQNNGSGWEDSWEMLASCSQAFGESFTSEQWEKVAAISSKTLHQGIFVRESIKKTLRIPGEKVGPAMATKIMAVAVCAEDLEMLALISSRAQSVNWLESDVACGFLCIHEQCAEPAASEVSMLTLGLARSKRKLGKDGRIEGRGCFEAIASIPEAVQAALATPSPRAMIGVDTDEFMELARRFPGIDKPDAEGNNVVHWWALANEPDGCKRKRFIRILNSPLRPLASMANNEGETPLSLMQKVLVASEAELWAKNFAAWERKDLAKSSEEGQGLPAAKSSRRSL